MLIWISFFYLPIHFINYLPIHFNDIHYMIVSFNSYYTYIHFQFNEKFSFNENLMIDNYFTSEPEGYVLILTSVLLARIPLILGKVSN